MSTAAINITTTINGDSNNQNELHAEITSNGNERAANVDDGRQNRRGREKGEKEKREDSVKRTPTIREEEREKVKQTNKNTDSVTQFTNEQCTCPAADNSMTNHVLSSFNSNNSSLSNNHSSHSTNTRDGNPETVHYMSSSNSHSMNRRFREYESSYPSITRYRTSVSSSPYRKTHYLDDSDEEIINEEILEIINLDHYPTLVERWGDDTKTIVRQEGHFKIEDYVEFDEIEPTIVEEILYEINYSGDQIESYKEIHHSRSESRNFRKIKKRRTKCKRQRNSTNIIEIDKRATELLSEMHNLSNKIDLIIQTGENFSNDDLSGDDRDITTNETYQIIPSIISGDRSSNIDASSKDISFSENEQISSQSLKSDERLSANESYIPSEPQLQSRISEHEEVPPIETPSLIEPFVQTSIQSTVTEEEFLVSTPIPQDTKHRSDQDLRLFLNSLLAHLIPESSDVDIYDTIFQPVITSEDEQASSDSLTETKPSTDSRVNLVQTADDKLSENTSVTGPEEKEEDEKSSTDSALNTQQENMHEDISAQKQSFDLQITESANSTIDQQESEPITTEITKKMPSEDEVEHLSYTEVIREILATSTPLHSSSVNSNTEITQQHTNENKEPSDSPIASVTVHLPLVEVNPEATSTLTDEQLEIISTPKEDRNIVPSSDSLAEIIRQILCTARTIHLPSVDHTTEANEQTNNIISPSKSTAHMEDNELLESNETFSVIETNDLIEAVRESSTTLASEDVKPTSDSLTEVVLESPSSSFKDADQKSNSSSPINHIVTEVISNEHNQSCSSDNVESEKIRSESPDQDYSAFEQTPSDFTLTNEKKSIPDLSKIYYELQDQRRIQSSIDYEQKEKKQKISDTNHPDFESFSLISNLPSREYRQVFGVSNEVISTVEDLTYHIASNIDQHSSISDEVKPQIIEALEDQPSIVSPNQEEKTLEDNSNSYVELDFRYSTLINRIDSLTQPLLASPTCDKEDDDQRHLRERYDILIDHVERLAETTNANLIVDNQAKTTEQILSTPLRTVTNSYEKTSNAATQFQSTDEKTISILPDASSIESNVMSNAPTTNTDEQEDLSSPSSEDMINNDKYGECQQSVEETSNIFTKLTSVLNNTISMIQNTLPIMTTSSTDTNRDHETEATLQASTADDKEHHGLVDFVVQAVSNVSSSDSLEESIDNTQLPAISNNDEEKQTFVETGKEVIIDTSLRTETQTIPSDTPWHTNQYKIADTEFDRLCSTDQPLSEKTPSSQQLQVIDDDYPWYSSYYTIVDAEVNLHRVYKQPVEFEHGTTPTSDYHHQALTETSNISEKDEDEFEVVQHHKHLPSAIQLTLSSDIDLELVHPEEHSEEPITIPQAENIISKKKHKKKKKNKKAMVLFDTSVPSSSAMNDQEIETVQSQVTEESKEKLHSISNVIVNEQQPETLSTSIKSNIEELKQTDNEKNESISSDASITALPQDIKINIQQPTDQETTSIVGASVTNSPQEEGENDEGFQSLQYNSDVDLKPQIIDEHQDSLVSAAVVIPSSTSTKKKNRHKKHKKETIPSSNINWSEVTDVQQQPTEQETPLQSQVPSSSSSIIDDSNLPVKSTLPSTIKTTTIPKKASASPDEKEEEDNEGFQVVRYRKRIVSEPESQNISTSLSAKTAYKQNLSRNTDIHGRHDSTSRSIPRTATGIQIPSNKNKQAPWFNTPPRSASTETHIISSSSIDNTFQKPKSIKQETGQLQSMVSSYGELSKDTEHETIPDVQYKLDQSTQPALKEYPVPNKEEIKPASSISTTDTQKLALIEDDDDGFQVVHHRKHTSSSTVSKQSSLISTIDQKVMSNSPEDNSPKSTTQSIPTKKKPKKNKKETLTTEPSQSTDILSSLTTDTDLIASPEKEMTRQGTINDTQQVSESPLITEDISALHSNETTTITSTSEMITPQISESVRRIDDTPVQFQPIKSSTITNEEPSNELSSKVDDALLLTETIESTDIPLSLSQIEPTTNTEDKQTKNPSSKKAAKRRKKKSRTTEKQHEESVSSSSTGKDISNTVVTHSNMESIVQRSDDNKQQQPERIITQNKKKTEKPIIDQTTETIPLSSSKITTTELLTSDDKHCPDVSATPSSHFIEEKQPRGEIHHKLDLFLPDYIRQQINTNKSATSSITHSTITSSETIRKKKQRPKMLKKDIEAKTLLTNEFDDIAKTNEEKSTPHVAETSIISTEQTADNILSRGFHLWLQESQALSQTKDKPSDNSNLIHTIQSLIIQPIENNNDDDEEDSWNTFPTNKPSYMIGTHPEKRIHTASAYSINHPQSLLTSQSKFDSDDEEEDSANDSSKEQHSHSAHTPSYTGNERQSSSIIPSFEPTDHIDDNNQSINFDDWAHFVQDKNSYQTLLSTSLECFYARTFDEDTLIANPLPIHQYEKQRYGDFTLSNENIILPESIINQEQYKSKPSDSFQKWQRQESYENDDEIFLSHSNNGLSRRVRP